MAETAAEVPSGFGGRWAWLAPVTGCFLALMVVSSPRGLQNGYLSDTQVTNWMAAVAQNQSYAAFAAAGFHCEQNALQQDPIEWTNGPRLTAAPTSRSIGTTNNPVR